MDKLGKTTLGNTKAKETKVNDDIQLILSKYKDMPPDDIKLMNIEVYYTDDHIVGFQSVYLLIDQKKKNSKKRKINDKISFQFEGHKSKGSKFFGVNSEVINLGPSENISKIFGIATDQIDKISFTTDIGRSFNFPPQNPINPKLNQSQQFYFELPQLSNLVGFKVGYSRFLNYIEIFYQINQSTQPKNKDFALNLSQNQSNMLISQNFQNRNNNMNNIPPNQQINQFNQIPQQQQQQYGQPISQQPNFNYPPAPQNQPQSQIQNPHYNYPSESQINGLNKPQGFAQQNNMGNQSSYPLQNNQFQQNNQPYNKQNIYQPLQQQSSFQQQSLFPSLNQNNNFGQFQQQQQQPIFQQQQQQQLQYYPPPPPPPSDQSFYDYPPMQPQNQQSYNSFQRSNTMQISNNYENNNRFANNNLLNGAGLISNNLQQNGAFQNQSIPLMRGQSLIAQPQKENYDLQYISQELRKILFSENPLSKLTIKEHKFVQNQSSLIGMVVPPHVSYIIEVENSDPNQEKILVERRYKEFDALRECLIESLPGIPVPMIPNKQIGNSLDERFILEREEELQIFLDEIVLSHPIYKFKGTQLFLNPKINQKTLISELDKIKEAVSGKNQKLLLTDYKRIFTCIDNFQLKQSMIDEVEAFKTMIIKKQERLEKLVNKAHHTREKMNTYYSILNNFKKNFIKDYEEQVLQGYKNIEGQQLKIQDQNQLAQMSDQDIMVQQTHISSQRFIMQYNILIREYRILAEFIRLFSFQNQLVQNYLKQSSKLLKTKVQSESVEIQIQMNYFKWMELFITKIFYFFYIPFHKSDQTKRYLKAVSSASQIEHQNNDNMRQYWIFVMLREQIEFDKVSAQYREKDDYLSALKLQSQLKKEEQVQLQQSQSQNTGHNQISQQNQLLQSQQQIQQQQSNFQQIIPNDNKYLQETLGNPSIADQFFNYPPAPQNQVQQSEQKEDSQLKLYSQLSEEQKNNQNTDQYSNYFSHYKKSQSSQLRYNNVMNQIESQISKTPKKSQDLDSDSQNKKDQFFFNQFMDKGNQEQISVSSQQNNQVKQKLKNQTNDDVFQQLFLQQLEINNVQDQNINDEQHNPNNIQQQEDKHESQENNQIAQNQDQNYENQGYYQQQNEQYEQQEEQAQGLLLCE